MASRCGRVGGCITVWQRSPSTLVSTAAGCAATGFQSRRHCSQFAKQTRRTSTGTAVRACDSWREMTRVKAACASSAWNATSFNAALLVRALGHPQAARQPYRVFTPFWRACERELATERVLAGPRQDSSSDDPRPDSLSSRGWSSCRHPWDTGSPQPGSLARPAASRECVSSAQWHCKVTSMGRDLPATDGSSRLSPHLHFGEVGPRQCLAAVRTKRMSAPRRGSRAAFLRELGWREFAHHLLYHFPAYDDAAARCAVRALPLVARKRRLEAWQRGSHRLSTRRRRNARALGDRLDAQPRADDRRFAAHQESAPALARRRTLVLGYAGRCRPREQHAGLAMDGRLRRRCRAVLSRLQSGTAGRAFRPQRGYLRRWLPELAALPDAWIHRPWDAPAGILAQAGVSLGHTYPRPIVDLRASRASALSAYQEIRTPQ